MLRSGGLDASRCSCRAVSSSSFWESLRMRARGRNRRRVEIERTRLPDALVRGGRVTRALLIRAKLVRFQTPVHAVTCECTCISMFSYELCNVSPRTPPRRRCISLVRVSLSESVPSRARTPLAPAPPPAAPPPSRVEWVGTTIRAPTGARVLEGVIKLPPCPPQARKFWRY